MYVRYRNTFDGTIIKGFILFNPLQIISHVSDVFLQSVLAWPAQYRLLKPHCRGVMRALRSQHSDPEISQSQTWTELRSQSEARVLVGEILKMITELAEIIVQRETKLRGAEMKVMRA